MGQQLEQGGWPKEQPVPRSFAQQLIFRRGSHASAMSPDVASMIRKTLSQSKGLSEASSLRVRHLLSPACRI